MPSIAKVKFDQSVVGAQVLSSFCGTASGSVDQNFVDQVCLRAAVANVVGCWEGYVEGVLREFVAKVRVQSHRRTWTLIAQYESLVDRLAADLNTPSWDRARDLLVTVTGMDPYSAWIWGPKFANQNDTKEFFDGVMKVRHAFAHGFAVPHSVPHLTAPGQLCSAYFEDARACTQFFVEKTDELLEHELKHRHSCVSGWT